VTDTDRLEFHGVVDNNSVNNWVQALTTNPESDWDELARQAFVRADDPAKVERDFRVARHLVQGRRMLDKVHGELRAALNRAVGDVGRADHAAGVLAGARGDGTYDPAFVNDTSSAATDLAAHLARAGIELRAALRAAHELGGRQ
jgi:hypothetical protein